MLCYWSSSTLTSNYARITLTSATRSALRSELELELELELEPVPVPVPVLVLERVASR